MSRFFHAPAPGVALFLLLLGWYMLTMSGHTYTSDEETMLAAAESLAEHGSFALPRDFLMNSVTGIDGEHYSRYGPGQSIAAVPFVLVGKLLAVAAPRYAEGFIVRLIVLLLPALITAATGLVLYAWAREVGYSVRVALLVGLLYGTSMAWPYSRTFFAEPFAVSGLVVCGYGLRRESPRWWLVAGAAAGVAVTVKLQALLALPVLAGYALLASWHGSPRASLGPLIRRAIAGVVGFVPFLMLLLLYNALLFGEPLKTGYGGVNPTGLLRADWREGLYGLLFSTGKGLLLFSPTVLLGIVGWFFGTRQQWRETLLSLAMVALNLAFYCRLEYWHGDGSWGPRYMMFVLPFLYLPAAGVLASVGKRGGRLLSALVGAVALLTFLVQLLPILVNLNTYIQMSDQYQRLFTPARSPMVGHLTIWRERVSEWWLRVDPPPGVVVLRDGFSYSEGDRVQGEILPRWTFAEARMQFYPYTEGEPLNGRIVVGDHRPWPLERAHFSLRFNGQPLDGVSRTDMTGQQIVWELRFHLRAEQVERGTTITLHSDTWNPDDDTEENPRDEDLGVRVEGLTFEQAGRLLDVREALPIPTVERDRRELWLWYYDTPRHHLFDAWLWYVVVAGLPPTIVVLLLALVGAPALLMVAAGGRGVVVSVT
jgi:hypothetical protein